MHAHTLAHKIFSCLFVHTHSMRVKMKNSGNSLRHRLGIGFGQQGSRYKTRLVVRQSIILSLKEDRGNL